MVIHCAKLTTRNHKKGQQIATFFKRSRKSSVPSLWRRTIASKVFNSNHMFCWENDADAKYLFSVGLRGGLWPSVPCNLTNIIFSMQVCCFHGTADVHICFPWLLKHNEEVTNNSVFVGFSNLAFGTAPSICTMETSASSLPLSSVVFESTLFTFFFSFSLRQSR